MAEAFQQQATGQERPTGQAAGDFSKFFVSVSALALKAATQAVDLYTILQNLIFEFLAKSQTIEKVVRQGQAQAALQSGLDNSKATRAIAIGDIVGGGTAAGLEFGSLGYSFKSSLGQSINTANEEIANLKTFGSKAEEIEEASGLGRLSHEAGPAGVADFDEQRFARINPKGELTAEHEELLEAARFKEANEDGYRGFTEFKERVKTDIESTKADRKEAQEHLNNIRSTVSNFGIQAGTISHAGGAFGQADNQAAQAGQEALKAIYEYVAGAFQKGIETLLQKISSDESAKQAAIQHLQSEVAANNRV